MKQYLREALPKVRSANKEGRKKQRRLREESKLCSGESKMSKVLTIACVQAVGCSFFQI